MSEDCHKLVDSYITWLRTKFSVEKFHDECEVTTPFLDRHNDHIQLSIRKKGDSYILSDNGYTISDLHASGFEFDSEKRRVVLRSILNGFGVKTNRDELFVETKAENFPQKKHNLIQAVLAINDLYIMASPSSASFFKEDVENYLSQKEIRFTSSVNFLGKSGYSHNFDFVIPPSKRKPERVIRALNNPNKQNVTSLIFSWTDTKEVRSETAKAYAIINDTEQKISSDSISAMSQYEIIPFHWSKREESVVDLLD